MLQNCSVMPFVATKNPARAKAFYRDTLGLTLTGEDGFALTFDCMGITLRVSTVEQLPAVSHTVLGWVTADIRSEIQALLKRGVTFERYGFFEQDELGVWVSPSGAKVAWFKDPDGNTLS